jgi:hypothetical protein
VLEEAGENHGQATGKLYRLRLLVHPFLSFVACPWFSPASSNTKTGRHDIAENGVKTPKINQPKPIPMQYY